MKISEWIEKEEIGIHIYKLVENAYRKGYNDGLIKANKIFDDNQLDIIANELRDRVFKEEKNDKPGIPRPKGTNR